MLRPWTAAALSVLLLGSTAEARVNSRQRTPSSQKSSSCVGKTECGQFVTPEDTISFVQYYGKETGKETVIEKCRWGHTSIGLVDEGTDSRVGRH